MTKFVGIVFGLLLTVTLAHADELTFLGQDLGLGEVTRLASHPNADQARADFFSHLIGVGTENFEGFAANSTSPLPVTFGVAGTATFSGPGIVDRVTTGTDGFGRYPISGDQFWSTQPDAFGADSFTIGFSSPVAAFGFYGVDIGDFNGQVTLTLSGGTTKTINIGNLTNIAGGSVLYFGLIETGTFSAVTFGNTSVSGLDGFGLDNLSVGSLQQVVPITPPPPPPVGSVPEPSTIALLGTILLVAWRWRSHLHRPHLVKVASPKPQPVFRAASRLDP